jgi:SAM-dependent methyltransferase
VENTETFQIPIEAAEIYEKKFVPAIFAEWAPHIIEAARVKPGNRVLDVACGTGVVARTAAGIVGPEGEVVGVDLNQAMLTVASRVRPDLAWRQGAVDDLPFDGDSFDAAVCQMAFMFFPDRSHAFSELGRVTRPGGRVAVVVPAALDDQPAYRQFVDIAAHHAGDEARALLSTYWSCGDLDALVATMTGAGIELDDARTKTGTARFDSAEDLVETEVEGSPLADRITPDAYSAIRRDVAAEMAAYSTPHGTFEIPLVCHVVAGLIG